MKSSKWRIVLGILLVALSCSLYLLSIILFRDPKNTGFYLLQDLAFVPMQVFLVTIVLDWLIAGREKQAMLVKLNMVIGVFFNETGSGLLKELRLFAADYKEFHAVFNIRQEWEDRDFDRLSSRTREHKFLLDSRSGNLNELRNFLFSKRSFLTGLLENPNLLEHQSFTELLWAVFHITEELACRPALEKLSERDLDHLSVDIKRAFVLLILEWISYMKHLKTNYPYLYSLAVRLNPFDPNATAEIK